MEDSKDISLQLSRQLDEVYVSKETIDVLRRLRKIKECHLNNAVGTSCEYVDIGSGADGSSVRDSDKDTMIVLKAFSVIDNNKEESACVPDLQMCYDASSSGSIILKLAKLNNNKLLDVNIFPNESIFHYMQNYIVSSSAFIDAFRKSGVFDSLKEDQTGPCINTLKKSAFGNKMGDIALAFSCPTWPCIAREWIFRKRTFGWPNKFLVTAIVNGGCHVVPIGDGDVVKSFFTWRLSFAVAETKLVQSFNHIQFKVYTLLKLFHKEKLEKGKDSDNALLCSYTMKTITFYAVENSPQTDWTDFQFFKCFSFCLEILISCVEKGYLPNYFIPKNNLFRKRVYGKSKTDLLSMLYECKSKGIECFEGCSFFNSLTGYSVPNEPGCLEDRHDRNIFSCEPLSNGPIFNMNISNKKALSTAFFILSKSENDIELYCSLTSLRGLLIQLASQKLGDAKNKEMNNMEVYSKRRMCRYYLLLCARMDTTRGWLTLATYHYLIGQYKESKRICDQVLERCSRPYVGLRGNDLHSGGLVSKMEHALVEPFTVETGFGSNPLNFWKCIMSLEASSIDFANLQFVNTKHVCLICPQELLSHVRDNKTKDLRYIPKPYAAFLSFLCLRAVNDNQKLQLSLSIIEDSLDNDFKMRPGETYAPSSSSLVSICKELLLQPNIQHCNIVEHAPCLMYEYRAYFIQPNVFGMIGYILEYQCNYGKAEEYYRGYLEEIDCPITAERHRCIKQIITQNGNSDTGSVMLDMYRYCISKWIDVSRFPFSVLLGSFTQNITF